MPKQKKEARGAESWAGSDALRGLLVPIETLREDPANLRLHPDRNIEALIASLMRFGQQKPIVVDTKGIVRAGNGLLAAARRLEWTHIAAGMTNLSDAELTAYAIADNRIAELSEWDWQGLSQVFVAMKDIAGAFDGLGFEAHEIQPLLEADWTPRPATGTLGGEGEGSAKRIIEFTQEQWDILQGALAKARSEGDAPDLDLATFLVSLCDDAE
jgi:hypothetical protein